MTFTRVSVKEYLKYCKYVSPVNLVKVGLYISRLAQRVPNSVVSKEAKHIIM